MSSTILTITQSGSAFPEMLHADASEQSYCICKPADPEAHVYRQAVQHRRRVRRGKKALRKAPKTPFAIRSGGHATNKGFSNIDGGVTLDLTSINAVKLLRDGVTVSAGTGAEWVDGIPCSGSSEQVVEWRPRIYHWHKGGFLSGVMWNRSLGFPALYSLGFEVQVTNGISGNAGGIGLFALKYGFGCDAVVNMEVVLSSGEVVNANSTSSSDLFVALKGGQNNFGIVTRWDITTILRASCGVALSSTITRRPTRSWTLSRTGRPRQTLTPCPPLSRAMCTSDR